MQLERVFRRRTQSALALLLAASAFGVVGCNDDKGTTTASVVPYLIQVTPPQSSLAVGGTQQLTAVVKDYYNNTMSTPVTWESSIPAVATVSATGLVTMVKAGSTTIVARVTPVNGQAYGTATVSAATPIANILINAPVNLGIGFTQQLTPVSLDASGGQLLPASYTYSSSASNIVSVSASGLLSALAAGSATITVSAGGKSATAAVQAIVFTPVNNITFSPASGAIIAGQTQTLAAIVKDAAGNVLTDKPITWATSAPSVATVSQTGVVTAVGGGVANITATSEGKVGTFTAMVPLVSGIALTGVGGANGSSTVYLVNVPANATSFTVRLAGGTGDADLFLYKPGVTFVAGGTRANTQCISENDVGVTELCTVTGAALTPGLWQIQLIGFTLYAGWTLTGTVVP